LKKKRKKNSKLKPSGKPVKPAGYRSKPAGKPDPNRTEGAFEFKFEFGRLPVNRAGLPLPEVGGYWKPVGKKNPGRAMFQDTVVVCTCQPLVRVYY
jgi:hypothetical protein